MRLSMKNSESIFRGGYLLHNVGILKKQSERCSHGLFIVDDQDPFQIPFHALPLLTRLKTE
jgi:hypothetical protein